jgi:hypothetical protein
MDRKRVLGLVSDADVTAIDAPVVPDLEHGHRTVERLLSGGLFQRRCKPGASHVPGTGLELRGAGRETATQFACITSERPLVREFPRVWGATNLVEAFPNAFLGMCVPDDAYRNMPKLRDQFFVPRERAGRRTAARRWCRGQAPSYTLSGDSLWFGRGFEEVT